MIETTPEGSKDQTLIHKWTVAVLAGLGVILVLIISATVAVAGMQNRAPRAAAEVVHVSGATFASTNYLSVSPGVKPGPDGQLHDAYSQTTFYVHAGRPTKLVIDNTDNVPHGIVTPMANVNIVVRPGTHTYTLLIKRTGTFAWNCSFPCDPFSMTHMGYMMGTIVSS
jgi:heme/copper-type cytochrome/quinol oxidase subunit 2